ncbi:MAG: response regulator transcription factor [Actinomycetota bacterium]|nr:response regulator transcription factor [Actinomycetota bacterium]
MLTGIKRALDDAEEIDLVGVTQRGDEVMDLVEKQRPDLMLLDGRMPGMDGVDCLKLIREHHPHVKVVMLSASEDAAQVAEALAAGASAYIGKRINPNDLASALRQIVAGVVHYAGPAAAEVVDQPSDLTERELTMLEAISRGLSTKAISRELWVSEKTVKFHLTNIYRKLGVHNRTGAMRYAFENGLIASPPSDDGEARTA